MMSLLDMEATVSWCDTGSSLSKSPIPHLSVLLDKIGRVSSTLGNFSFFLYKSGAKKVRSLEVAIFGGNRSRHLEKEKKEKKNWSDPESGKMSATDASNKFKGPFSVFVEYFLISYCTPTPHKHTLPHLPLPLSPLSLTHTHTLSRTIVHLPVSTARTRSNSIFQNSPKNFSTPWERSEAPTVIKIKFKGLFGELFCSSCCFLWKRKNIGPNFFGRGIIFLFGFWTERTRPKTSFVDNLNGRQSQEFESRLCSKTGFELSTVWFNFGNKPPSSCFVPRF